MSKGRGGKAEVGRDIWEQKMSKGRGGTAEAGLGSGPD